MNQMQKFSLDLDEHLSVLDSAPISFESVFKNQNEKERYETLITYAYRKLTAAQYHLIQVEKFVEKISTLMSSFDLPEKSEEKGN